MADSASQAHSSPGMAHVRVAALPSEPLNESSSTSSAQPITAHSVGEPLALTAVSGNVGTTVGTTDGINSTPQLVVSKPSFNLKQTSHSTLPHAAPTFDRSSSNIPTPTVPYGHHADPEPAQIVSDILPPKPPSTPTLNATATHLKSNSASDGTRKTKYATDEERRKATSLALKRTLLDF